MVRTRGVSRALSMLAIAAALAHCSPGVEHEDEEPNELEHRAIDEASFQRIIEDRDFSETLKLVEPEDSHTLVRNCRFLGIQGDGILLRNVVNVTIVDSEFRDIKGQAAIRGSMSGGTRDVRILGNTIGNVAENGISFGQRAADGVDHPGLVIEGNRIRDTGQSRSDGKSHSIYVQSGDFEIVGNVISGSRDGNGISLRSSGKAIGNRISGKAKSDKPGIRYYSDHQRGASNELLIEANRVSGQRIGIDLADPVDRYDGKAGIEHVVRSFVLKANELNDCRTPISVSERLGQAPFSVFID